MKKKYTVTMKDEHGHEWNFTHMAMDQTEAIAKAVANLAAMYLGGELMHVQEHEEETQ